MHDISNATHPPEIVFYQGHQVGLIGISPPMDLVHEAVADQLKAA
jgi:hypothetical protein